MKLSRIISFSSSIQPLFREATTIVRRNIIHFNIFTFFLMKDTRKPQSSMFFDKITRDIDLIL